MPKAKRKKNIEQGRDLVRAKRDDREALAVSLCSLRIFIMVLLSDVEDHR